MLRLELPGKEAYSRRPNRRFINVVKEDIEVVGVKEEAVDRVRYRQMICCDS